MAPTKKCPQCNQVLYAQDEKHEPKGTTVRYVCRTNGCNFAEKVFVSN